MESNTEYLSFLEALGKLPLIRKYIISLTQEIIKSPNSEGQELELIRDVRKKLVSDLGTHSIRIDPEDALALEYGIEMLLKSQLPLSRQAANIRKLKGNPPKGLADLK